MKPDEVAAVTLNGIKSGTFSVACNFDGVMLSVATAGFSPQRSYLVAFLEVVTAGFMRIMGLYYQWSWYRTIERWHLQKNSEYFMTYQQSVFESRDTRFERCAARVTVGVPLREGLLRSTSILALEWS